MSGLVVVTTGGTIATSADTDGVLRPARGGAELVAGLDAEFVDVLAVDSSQLVPADWVRIAAAVDGALAGGADGVVVTHGTDTLEETALWLELTYGGAAPVVLTGAARAADDPDADGPANLRDALSAAASPLARDLGVLICFAGALLAPLGTTKLGGAAVFGGSDPVGVVSDGGVSLSGGKRRAFLGPVGVVPRVDIASAYPGADGTAIDAFADAGARGLVVDMAQKLGAFLWQRRIDINAAADLKAGSVRDTRHDGDIPVQVGGTQVADGGGADSVVVVRVIQPEVELAQYPVHDYAQVGQLVVLGMEEGREVRLGHDPDVEGRHRSIGGEGDKVLGFEEQPRP